jgi:hypothetical protein
MPTDEFDNMVRELVHSAKDFEPAACYDPDGDCLEFHCSEEPFTAERLDKWVTVYRGRESNEVVGSLIKNIRQLLSAFPGLRIDIESGPVKLEHMLIAPWYANGDRIAHGVYREVVERVKSAELSADLEAAIC